MDIRICNLAITIHGREFPESNDYWDRNWLLVSVAYSNENTTVLAGGPIIHLSEIESFLKKLENIDKTLQGSASLSCMEPNLSVHINMKSLGKAEMITNITPDHLLEEHRFKEEIDQSYFKEMIMNLKNVFNTYEIGKKPEE
jgi:hypothetical protein